VVHGERFAFSLDGAKTKFPCLEHLVDFHKMNCGPLPITLNDVDVDRIPLPSPLASCAVAGEFNNNCDSDMGHWQQQLEHGQHDLIGAAASSSS